MLVDRQWLKHRWSWKLFLRASDFPLAETRISLWGSRSFAAPVAEKTTWKVPISNKRPHFTIFFEKNFIAFHFRVVVHCLSSWVRYRSVFVITWKEWAFLILRRFFCFQIGAKIWSTCSSISDELCLFWISSYVAANKNLFWEIMRTNRSDPTITTKNMNYLHLKSR